MFFAASNLTEQSLAPSEPWLFEPTEQLTELIRTDKAARQEFYRDKRTSHNFYSLVEPSNPNQRTTKKDNPPRRLHGIVVDYDMTYDADLVATAIEKMRLKPVWLEISLSGNYRLVWTFSKPIAVESYEFCVALLQASQDWLQLSLLPGVDGPALGSPEKLYCNGCNWTPISSEPINEAAVQAFFVKTGAAYRFQAGDGVEIPLDVVEKALREKYPSFSWPGPFELESKGASFWIPGSTSPMSAILKPEGFFTFAAHAEKPFYRWADLLDAEFVKVFEERSVAKATLDIWHDGKKFWRQKRGVYVGMEMAETINYLQVQAGVKGPKLATALNHIYNECHVDSVGPFLFQPTGLLEYQGLRKLNTADVKVRQPAARTQAWGPQGNFPFLSELFDSLFTSELQRDWFLAWFAYFYRGGLEFEPAPGQAVFLMGGVGVGKSFVSREVVGRAVGGYVDASGYLCRTESFNSHLFSHALWAVDDETISPSPHAAASVQAALKKAVANSSFLNNRKFQVAGMLEWMGRIILTANLDFSSSRLLGPLDPSTRDKVSILRCTAVSSIKFPSRPEMRKLVETELQFFLRWLVDYEAPETVIRDSRFGVRAHHETTLTDQAAQTSRAAPFKEILVMALERWFSDNPTAPQWRGTMSQLVMLIHADPRHELVIRTLRLEAVSRYLEAIETDGALQVSVETGNLNTRVWVFQRFASGLTNAEPVPQGVSIFNK